MVSTDDPSQKAVSIGAALFFLKEVVIARAARFDYGTKITVTVSKEAKELGRRKVYTATDGKQRTRGGTSLSLDDDYLHVLMVDDGNYRMGTDRQARSDPAG